LIALAGKNERLLEKLKKLSKRFPGRFYPSGFTNTIERLMTCADVAITKPGGLTSSECIALGLPMLIIDPIPGQEERNADYLLEKGAAIKAIDEIELEFKVRLLLNSQEKIKEMSRSAFGIGTPDSAKAVLDVILKD
jgi:processive 1,2-diacylglycerol beta-glucosyltransferase